MIRQRVHVVAALVIAALAVPAIGQDSGNYGRPEQTPENMVRFALFRFSSCAMRHSAITANKLLTTDLASDQEAKLVKSLRTTARDCYGPEWPGFTATEVRNAIAEVRYRMDFRSAPVPVSAPNEPPPASFAVTGAKASGTPAEEVSWYLGGLANCIVFTDAQTAHRLVLGPFGVAEEGKRFDALKPAVFKCSGKDAVPGLTARLLRGYLANALLVRMKAMK